MSDTLVQNSFINLNFITKPFKFNFTKAKNTILKYIITPISLLSFYFATYLFLSLYFLKQSPIIIHYIATYTHGDNYLLYLLRSEFNYYGYDVLTKYDMIYLSFLVISISYTVIYFYFLYKYSFKQINNTFHLKKD